jgi:hypothetical protein
VGECISTRVPGMREEDVIIMVVIAIMTVIIMTVLHPSNLVFCFEEYINPLISPCYLFPFLHNCTLLV